MATRCVRAFLASGVLFLAAAPAAVFAQTPTVAVSSPIGGETYVLGKDNRIEVSYGYTNADPSQWFRYYFVDESSGTRIPIWGLTHSGSGTNETPYLVDGFGFTDGHEYRLLVEVSNAEGAIIASDASPATFRVTSVVSPRLDLAVGTSIGVEIYWEEDDGGGAIASVRIYRSTSSDALGTLIASVAPLPGTRYGSYTDTTAVTGTTYYYILRSVNADGVESSDPYEYATAARRGTSPRFSFTEPQDGTVWRVQDDVAVTWSDAEQATADELSFLYLFATEEPRVELLEIVETAAGTLAADTFLGTSFASIPSGEYRLRIISLAEDVETVNVDADLAGTITIPSRPIQNVALRNSGGSETTEFLAGSEQEIVWETDGSIPTVNIDLFDPASLQPETAMPFLNIATNITNTEFFRWTLPSSLSSDPDTFYSIRVFDATMPREVAWMTADEYEWSLGFTVAVGPTRLVRYGDERVYYETSGRRLWIPSAETFTAAGLRWEDVQTGNPAEVVPRLMLARAGDDPKVFYLTQSGRKKHIPNPETFVSYGNRWEDVVSLPAELLAALSDIAFIHLDDDPRVYKLENGQKRWVRTPTAFERIGGDWTTIAPVNATELAAYAEGAPVE